MKYLKHFPNFILICLLPCLACTCSENTSTSPPPASLPDSEAVSSAVSRSGEDPVEDDLVDPFAEFEAVPEDDDVPPPAFATGEGIQIDPKARLPKYLAEYNLFADPANQTPNEGLVPYYLNTGHFANNAEVSRFLWIPPGEKAVFHPVGPFEFPTGTALIQSFSFPASEDPESKRLLETRVMINQPDGGWTLSSYKWDDSGTSARKAVAGGLVPVSYRESSGKSQNFSYLIPNMNDCKRCHVNADRVITLGLTARNLNTDADYGAGPTNQLAHWVELGLLEGAPDDLSRVDRGADWSDPATGTLTERARMWLDVNCAHCHNPEGAGSVSGLDLRFTQDNPVRYGVYKPPVAAGRGSEGHRFSIEPGSPDTSFLVLRLLSSDPSTVMPPLDRMTPDLEGAELISEWIDSLSFDEETAMKMIAEQEEATRKLREQAALEEARYNEAIQ